MVPFWHGRARVIRLHALTVSVPTNTSMRGQLGHRDQEPLVKQFDTDFPEPGENPEHNGEPEVLSEDEVG